MLFDLIDDICSVFSGLPPQRRIERWQRWIDQDGWTQEEINEFVPEVVKPFVPVHVAKG